MTEHCTDTVHNVCKNNKEIFLKNSRAQFGTSNIFYAQTFAVIIGIINPISLVIESHTIRSNMSITYKGAICK